MDISIVKKDEEIRQLSLSQTRVTIGGEKLLQSSFIDITEQKQTKEALVLERSYFKQLFESAQEAIVMSDIDTKILRVNNEFTKMFGYTSEEVQGRIIDDIIIPKKAKGEANSISKRVSTGDKIACEAVRCRKDGSLIDVSILASPIIIDNKQVGVYGIYRDISKRKQMENELLKSYKKLHNSLMSTVNTMASTFEIRDPYTTGHQQRVAKLACAIAEKMRLDEKQIEGIRIAGLLHDIGKIGIPAEILNKPARLTKDEFNFIKNHPQIAYDVLKKIDFPWPVAQMVLQHHEKLDGSGYPQGLSGKNILIEARILTVSDIVEAMSAHRPYRPALKLKIIFDEITINRNRLFDPNVVDACLILFKNQKFKHDWNKKG